MAALALVSTESVAHCASAESQRCRFSFCSHPTSASVESQEIVGQQLLQCSSFRRQRERIVRSKCTTQLARWQAGQAAPAPGAVAQQGGPSCWLSVQGIARQVAPLCMRRGFGAPGLNAAGNSHPQAVNRTGAVGQAVSDSAAPAVFSGGEGAAAAQELDWRVSQESGVLEIAVQVAASGDEAVIARIAPASHAASEVPAGKGNIKRIQVERLLRRKLERRTYLLAAVASSAGFIALAGGAVLYRFISQMQAGGQVPHMEIFGTFALAVGAAVGMEFWARWAHRALWHASLWNMHESHHKPREGPFELNDVFAIINAGPAIALLAFGFFNRGFIPGLCFGAGLGITLFGMAYMFVHDGLVHRRFPVGPIAEVPYLQRVAAAHQLHHADKFKGVPYGLFLGVEELHRVGGLEDLEALLKSRGQARAAAELGLRFKVQSSSK